MNKSNKTAENDLIQELISEKKSNRRWKNIRFFILIALIAFFFSRLSSLSDSESTHLHQPYYALIRLNGTIASNTGFSASRTLPELSRAFSDKDAKGVLLLINSPGGSPTQATIIHDKILDLKKHYRKKVIVVGEDSLASAAYLVATAADKIYVNPNTVTGSIGVIMASFNLSGLIKKLGIKRRVFTAGIHKDAIDTYRPMSQASQTKIQSILDQTHKNFINLVLDGRKNKINPHNQTLFTGEFWLGNQATKLGLADGVMEYWQAAKKEFGTQRAVDYTDSQSSFSQIVKQFATSLSIPVLTQSHLHILEMSKSG